MTTKNEPEQGYQGWTNYETWAVALWVDNDEPLYRESRRMVRLAWERAEDEDSAEAAPVLNRSERARYTLADGLKDWLSEMAPDLGASLWSDLLTAALSGVNWDEIADNWLSEVKGYEPRK